MPLSYPQLIGFSEGAEIRAWLAVELEPLPIREAAFANLKAPLRPVRAPIDPTGASAERKALGR